MAERFLASSSFPKMPEGKAVRMENPSGGLNLRELDDQYPREEQCRDGDECQPEYFESPFDGLICLYMSQLAKIVKISDKIRIFVP